MFMGEYQHSVDAKGRLIIPSKYREQLGDKMVVTKGLDTCLYLYPMEGGEVRWPEFAEGIGTKVQTAVYRRSIGMRIRQAGKNPAACIASNTCGDR